MKKKIFFVKFYKTTSSSVLFHLLMWIVVKKLRHKTPSPLHFPLDVFSLGTSIPVQQHRFAHWETLWLVVLVRKKGKRYCHICSPSPNGIWRFCIHVQREDRRNYGSFSQQTKTLINKYCLIYERAKKWARVKKSANSVERTQSHQQKWRN